MKILSVNKVGLNIFNNKCQKCVFNNGHGYLCVFVKCISTEREDRENIYFKLIDMDNKSE